MSTLSTLRVSCLKCGLAVQGEVAIVANFDRRPDLRRAVLEGSYNRLNCEACGHRVTVARTTAVADFQRGVWLVSHPEWAEIHWQDLAGSTRDQLQRVILRSGPAALADVLDGLQVRVVFGLDALREKLVIADAGLDDRTVEVAKVALLAGRPAWGGVRLLLWEVTEDHLRWVALKPGGHHERMVTDHAPLSASLPGELSLLDLTSDPFVSYRRWLVPPQPADPLAFDLEGHVRAEAAGHRQRALQDETPVV